MYAGNWQDDKIYGEYVYISGSMRVMGKLSSERGLEGFQIIQILGDTGYDKREMMGVISPMTLYGVYKGNRLFGRCVIAMKEYIYICNANIE